MSVISMKQLLEAGVHFGHQTRRWNPKMAPYIFMERNSIYIIDLQKTVDLIDEAYSFVREVAASNKPILFVGTKKQAQQVIKDEALRCESYYVNERWLGGMLTNYKTISERIRRLADIEKMEDEGVFEQLTKKEVSKLRLEHDKLEKFLGGIKDMKGMPGALFVVEPKKERIAIKEARILGIPIIGIVDTNCDPDDVDFVIPANDDAIRAIKLITAAIADAVIESHQGVSFSEDETEEEMPDDEEASVDGEVTEEETPGDEKASEDGEAAEEETPDDDKASDDEEAPEEKIGDSDTEEPPADVEAESDDGEASPDEESENEDEETPEDEAGDSAEDEKEDPAEEVEEIPDELEQEDLAEIDGATDKDVSEEDDKKEESSDEEAAEDKEEK